jgi:CRISPR-associated protein Cas2
MFDLPVKEEEQRREYVRFRKDLLNDGFAMMQYSVYHRHCMSTENAQVHVQRLTAALPPEGEVRFMVITDKQFEKIVTHWGKERRPHEKTPNQLEFL